MPIFGWYYYMACQVISTQLLTLYGFTKFPNEPSAAASPPALMELGRTLKVLGCFRLHG
jgi:hypothetical protein